MERINSHNPELDKLGIDIRRKLFGDERIDSQLNSPHPFMETFYDLLHHHCFADIWDRDGLEWSHRSMITIAILVALGKPAELELHVGAARRNGLSWEQINEVLLHAMVYCGIPAGVEAFRVAKSVYDAEESSS